MRVGVDAGGTFTDFVTSDGRTLKLPSRPDDPAAVVLDGLRTLAIEACELVFSTTAATNALLTRSGGPTILFTTAGFEDVLELARQTRPELYALEPEKPAPLIDVAHRLGVQERVAVDGVVVALTDAEIERVAALVPREHTVAICFLHAYRFGDHEERLARRLRTLGHHVSLSSEVAPLPREYERTSTTVIDAYVAPALGRTLETLRTRTTLRVMESTGGARSTVRPARTVLSGPAAGVIAAERLAQRLSLARAMALDIGGTSTDLALLRDGRAARVEELLIDGMPIALPSVAVRTVGAGGGSIAWIDAAGVLKLGPRSAGAVPGPAAYARGGTEPTVTDAHVVLGRLGDSICGGTVPLDHARANAALLPIATQLACRIEEAASAIVAVTDAAVARAAGAAALGEARESLALVAYGGASGLHAVEVARLCGISRVIVPREPGLFCARGALDADVIVEHVRALTQPLDTPYAEVVAMLVARVERELASEAPQHAHTIETTARVRYDGQGIDGELELPTTGLDVAHFTAAHRDAYGYVLDRAVVLTSVRVRGRATIPMQSLTASLKSSTQPTPTQSGHIARASLGAGATLRGPQLIDEASATLWLPEGATVTVNDAGDLLITA